MGSRRRPLVHQSQRSAQSSFVPRRVQRRHRRLDRFALSPLHLRPLCAARERSRPAAMDPERGRGLHGVRQSGVGSRRRRRCRRSHHRMGGSPRPDQRHLRAACGPRRRDSVDPRRSCAVYRRRGPVHPEMRHRRRRRRDRHLGGLPLRHERRHLRAPRECGRRAGGNRQRRGPVHDVR